MSVPPPPHPPYYGYGYGYGQPPPRTNGMAIAALVGAFIVPPLGIVFGHVSLAQIRRTREEGRPLALAGLVVGYALTVLGILAVVVAVVLAVVAVRAIDESGGVDPRSPLGTAGALPTETLPDFAPPASLGGNCQYPATTEPGSTPARTPRAGRVPTQPATVQATMATDDGSIGLDLDNEKAPCTVNSFVSLAQQGYFDGTRCHRLTTSRALGVLQCGDPTATGRGGPGYRFPNEYPTNQYRMSDPALQRPIRYPRGTLAMANAGPGTNGSQFFLVYRDSALPPTYTAFGRIDETGLAVVDDVAAEGVADGGDDGTPRRALVIDSIRLE